MREIRLSGSEGGGAELNRPSLPLSSVVAGSADFGDSNWVRIDAHACCFENRWRAVDQRWARCAAARTRCAPAAPRAQCASKRPDQRGESPLQANALRPVTECNCVAVRRGGEQQEVNDPSVG